MASLGAFVVLVEMLWARTSPPKRKVREVDILKDFMHVIANDPSLGL